jgi:hypothetical protein
MYTKFKHLIHEPEPNYFKTFKLLSAFACIEYK